MKTTNYLKLMSLALLFVSCQKNDISNSQASDQEKKAASYSVLYTDQQLINWKETGNPFLESEHKNSKNTLIDKNIPSQGGVFEPIPIGTKAFGVHPYQNRFWSMIRLKVGLTLVTQADYELKQNLTDAISEIEAETNIRFYNSLYDLDEDPVYHFKYPNVHISKATGNKKGSSYIGLQGGEQNIYLPEGSTVAFIKRALVNVAGMYNEQQRNDRDTYVNINTNNVDPDNRYHFDKITTNYYSIGSFDFNSITLAGSTEFSNNGLNSIWKKDGSTINSNQTLSNTDRAFINYFYLPYIARTDNYRQLDDVVYDGNNVQLTTTQRQQLQDYLNNYAPYPGDGNIINQQPF
ncbi:MULTISPECIES: M12 family metallopeptidase [unclassified Sphingobacterium]|uniref:M12 family metallopeptidase n=1 Tax=unclassified Sphingobacterium TaxID=2609468 RepID=UPI0029537E62|nr:M12 family metallopeptidase [Sphingobacterium sp. UGAL515B_05]WON97154.1 M12 family metallopeptidase [Sphingobacterium sp. UGAL515B_05]